MGISITGLSGFDTAQMVNDLMALERIPYKNLESKKTNLRSEQNVFRNINTAFSTFSTALTNLRYAADWNKLKATSSSNAVSVSSSLNVTPATYDLNVKQLATKNVVEIDASHMLDQVNAAIADPAKELKIGNYTFTEDDLNAIAELDGDEAQLKKLAQIINSKTNTEDGSNATASVLKTSSDGNFKLILNSKNTGEGPENAVSFTLGTTNIIDDSHASVINKAGKDAIVDVNGVTVTRSSNTFNDLAEEGLTFTLNSVGESKVTVGQDVDAIVKNVKSFVDAYNNLISLVKTNLSKPADDSKMNPLQGDSLLKRIDSQLYSIFNSIVDTSGGKAWMEQIGLSIDKGVGKASLMTGKITFDEAAFKDALVANPQKVIDLFAKNERAADPDNGIKADPGGIITQFTSIMSSYTSTVNGMLSNKITGYDSEIKMIDDRLDHMDRRLQMTEARLKLQFSTMETMLSTLNNQKDWLTSQLESLNKSK
ncbi:flagellar filament capping protein FliD [Paenibacillus septentrionalis]|uniref:Flagellar hook-associated protein 2 n=1 Tax=Paenibacillus septentrionalis TaxID=429342 RepID=A0ABW1VBN4_9BACL